MQAIEFEAVPYHHAIPIPENIQVSDGRPVRVLLLIDNEVSVAKTEAPCSDGDAAFHLLADLSEDFFADGRNQPGMQVRVDL